MSDFNEKLSLYEIERLLRNLSTTNEFGEISREAELHILRDKFGKNIATNAKVNTVRANRQGFPETISFQESKIIDCGHAVHSPNEILGRCNNRHLVCTRHEFFRCAGCTKTLCHLCYTYEKNGKIFCGWVCSWGN